MGYSYTHANNFDPYLSLFVAHKVVIQEMLKTVTVTITMSCNWSRHVHVLEAYQNPFCIKDESKGSSSNYIHMHITLEEPCWI